MTSQTSPLSGACNTPPTRTRFLRLEQVMDMTGLKCATIYKRMKLGTFPRSVPIGGRAVAWLENEVIAWQTACIEARDQDLGFTPSHQHLGADVGADSRPVH